MTRRLPFDGVPLVGLAGYRLAPDSSIPDPDVLERIDIDGVLYVFTRGAVGGALQPAVQAAWLPKIPAADHRVYVRTEDAFYVVMAMSLRGVAQLLPRDRFERTSRSMVTNLARAQVIHLRGRRPHLEIPVGRNDFGWGWELVHVGRDYLPAVRARFAL